jgi:hypothetical protein
MLCSYLHSHVSVSRHGVWISNWIYWTLRFACRFFCFGAHVLTGWQLARNELTSSHQVKFMSRLTVLISSPSWGPRPDFCYCQTVAGLLMWGHLSDERTGPSFTTAAGSRQGSYSQARVLWDSWPYFTLSDSRFPKPGGLDRRIYIPQEQSGPVIPQALDSLFVSSDKSQGYGGGIGTRLHTGTGPRYIAAGRTA